MVGPTSVGKSTLGCAIAKAIGGEVLGADAFQVYSDLGILTAQPGLELTSEVPHHLFGCVPLDQAFDVAAYLALASAAIRDVTDRGRVPVIVGGTGLYVRALISGLAPVPPSDAALRADLDTMDLESLVGKLRALDPDAPAQLDLRNRRRVQRAVEICTLSGQPLAEFRQTPKPDGARGIFLVRDRAELHARIASQIDLMFESGVVDEVHRALPVAGSTARKAIGFEDIAARIEGRLGEDDCRERMRVATLQYAKRQLTWFRHQHTFPTLDVTSNPLAPPVLERALRTLNLT